MIKKSYDKSNLVVIIHILSTVVCLTHCIEAPKCCEGNNLLDIVNLNCEVLKLGDTTTSTEIQLNCTEGKYLIDPTQDEDEEFIVNAQGQLEMPVLSVHYPPDTYCLTNKNENGSFHQIAVACFTEETSLTWFTFEAQAILLFLSVFFIGLTLFIYFIVPELRETQDITTCITLACLMIFLLFLALVKLVEDLNSFNVVCVSFAFVIYFFSLAYFSWLNMVMANVWKSTVMFQWKIDERKWFLLNNLYAWSIPVVLTGVTLRQHSFKPTFGVQSCWFASSKEQWYFMYIPISVLLSLNVVLFLWISYYLRNPEQNLTPDRRKVLKYRCTLYVKLFLLGGLTWIFEVLSFRYGKHENNNWFWALTDVVNCLHGFLIFLVLIVWRKRIRRELGGRKVCCFTMPQRWTHLADDEGEDTNDDGGTNTRLENEISITQSI